MTSGQPDDYQIRVHVIEARQLRGAWARLHRAWWIELRQPQP